MQIVKYSQKKKNKKQPTSGKKDTVKDLFLNVPALLEMLNCLHRAVG